jgi:hypothetical protein
MGRLPEYGQSSHLWADFPYMGRLPMYGQSAHQCKDFPYMRSLPIQGKTSLIGEVLTYMGRHPTCGKSAHMCPVLPYILEGFACVGSLPMYGKSSHVWEDFPYMGRLAIHGNIKPEHGHPAYGGAASSIEVTTPEHGHPAYGDVQASHPLKSPNRSTVTRLTEMCRLARNLRSLDHGVWCTLAVDATRGETRFLPLVGTADMPSARSSLVLAGAFERCLWIGTQMSVV